MDQLNLRQVLETILPVGRRRFSMNRGATRARCWKGRLNLKPQTGLL